MKYLFYIFLFFHLPAKAKSPSLLSQHNFSILESLNPQEIKESYTFYSESLNTVHHVEMAKSFIINGIPAKKDHKTRVLLGKLSRKYKARSSLAIAYYRRHIRSGSLSSEREKVYEKIIDAIETLSQMMSDFHHFNKKPGYQYRFMYLQNYIHNLTFAKFPGLFPVSHRFAIYYFGVPSFSKTYQIIYEVERMMNEGAADDVLNEFLISSGITLFFPYLHSFKFLQGLSKLKGYFVNLVESAVYGSSIFVMKKNKEKRISEYTETISLLLESLKTREKKLFQILKEGERIKFKALNGDKTAGEQRIKRKKRIIEAYAKVKGIQLPKASLVYFDRFDFVERFLIQNEAGV